MEEEVRKMEEIQEKEKKKQNDVYYYQIKQAEHLSKLKEQVDPSVLELIQGNLSKIMENANTKQKKDQEKK